MSVFRTNFEKTTAEAIKPAFINFKEKEYIKMSYFLIYQKANRKPHFFLPINTKLISVINSMADGI